MHEWDVVDSTGTTKTVTTMDPDFTPIKEDDQYNLVCGICKDNYSLSADRKSCEALVTVDHCINQEINNGVQKCLKCDSVSLN
jgi:hypothetical protein